MLTAEQLKQARFHLNEAIRIMPWWWPSKSIIESIVWALLSQERNARYQERKAG